MEPALYALLCDKKSSTRATVDKALKGGASSATAILAPLLITQFALAPAVAAVVAAVAVQAVATAGQKKLCQELAESKKDDDDRPKPPERKKRTPKPKQTKPKVKRKKK